MVVRTENVAGEPARREAGEGDRVPVFTGSLDSMLGSAPVFRSKLRGYDPMEVDSYVSWAESELRTVRRQVDDLLARFGACSAELEISRRLLADGSRNRVVFPVSDRVEEMLQLAVDEAAAITETAARDAEHIVAEARSEADARLRKAHEIKEMAVLAADELRDQARTQRAEAQAVLDRARAEADALRQSAAQERDRLAAAAAEERQRLDADAAREREQAAAAAAERLAELSEEVAELHRQRDQARQSLRGLSSRIGEALQAVAGTLPDTVGAANVAIEGMEYDPAHVGAAHSDGAPEQRAAGEGLVLVGRPAPVSS